MTAKVKELLRQIDELDVEERDSLLDHLLPPFGRPMTAAELEAALDEAASADLDAEELVPHEEAMAGFRRRAAALRAARCL